jgi:hypothetical protein
VSTVHIDDQFLASPRRLFQILESSNIPWHRNGSGWLTHCPLHPQTGEALLVTEEHADDCTFKCEQG